MTQPRKTRIQASRNWKTWALVASVAANVAVAVAILAASFANPPHGPSRDRAGGRGIGGPPGMAALTNGLDRAERDALFRALRADDTLRAARARMGAAQTDVVTALSADPFVPAAFEAALLVQRDLQGALAERGIAALSTVVSGLSAEERAAIALRIAERRRP